VTTSLSDLIPKEQLSAYQRWELASLHEADSQTDVTSAEAKAANDALAEREAAAARERGHGEGFAAGYQAGVARADSERERVQGLLATLADHAGAHEQRLLDEVLDFALLLARQLVGEALAVRRELVLPVVSAALKQLPQASQTVQLLLNPSDLELVRTFLSDEPLPQRFQLVADVAVAPGGCRIETEQCEVDATLPSRWRRLLANLGRSDDWIEPI
jgi:flagellar assembly protein FliH